MRLSSLLLLLLFVFISSAQAVDEKYLKDGSGRVVIDGSKRCVIDGSHSSDYTRVEACGDTVAVTPPPPPPTVEVPRPPEPTVRRIRETITISSETLFAFNKSVLSPAGEAELDRLIRKLQDYSRVISVTVIGHTDRIGSDAYNQRLSERRANTVANYLKSKGISSSIMTVIGRGESEPIVSCEGLKGKALISCLAPNRRVNVNVDAEEIVFRLE
jgi:OOP family OmpA-OmpF porin